MVEMFLDAAIDLSSIINRFKQDELQKKVRRTFPIWRVKLL